MRSRSRKARAVTLVAVALTVPVILTACSSTKSGSDSGSGGSSGCTDPKRLASREARRTLLDIGAHRFQLIGPAHQFHLLDRFG